MKTFLCLLLVIFSFISYVGITPKLGIYMYHPIPHYLGMLIGIGLLVRLMLKQFTKRRLAATLFSVFTGNGVRSTLLTERLRPAV